MRPIHYLLALVALSGCTGPTSSEAQSVIGRYALKSIGGKGLPYTVWPAGQGSQAVLITADTLSLNADLTFTIKQVRTGSRFNDGEPFPQAGFWRLDGTVVRLRDNVPAVNLEWFRGPWIQPNRLELTHNAGSVFLYERTP